MHVILQERFQQRLGAMLAEKGMSQSELARRMGVPHSQVHKYLKGAHSPGLDMLERFCTALECDPFDLIGEKTTADV